MRVNVDAEEITERVEIISKEIDGQVFTGLRLYLELPATVDGRQVSGPFIHGPGDDDSSAVTFWGTPQHIHMLAAVAADRGDPVEQATVLERAVHANTTRHEEDVGLRRRFEGVVRQQAQTLGAGNDIRRWRDRDRPDVRLFLGGDAEHLPRADGVELLDAVEQQNADRVYPSVTLDVPPKARAGGALARRCARPI